MLLLKLGVVRLGLLPRSVISPTIFVPCLKEMVPVGVPMKEKVGVTVADIIVK